MADDTDTEAWPGYTPEEMDLPPDLVERIKLVCSLLHLPVAERHSEPGVRLEREGAWRPGEPADHVIVSWKCTARLLDACENQEPAAERLWRSLEAIEDALADALRRGGLRVERDAETRDWKVLSIIGPSPVD